MSPEQQWQKIILGSKTPSETWAEIFDLLKERALATISPVELHKQTIPADRLLAESAWNLWEAYTSSAPRTSSRLKAWCSQKSASGKAILVLDALSMNELPLITGGAKARGIHPESIDSTGSEIPSDTDSFALALGAPSRSLFQNNNPPAGFTLFNNNVFTDVLESSFADCCGVIPPEHNVFIWHSWIDNMIHVYRKTPDQIHSSCLTAFQSDGFWKFIDALRQGRDLIITGDHGYTNSKLFSGEESEQENIDILRATFGASRCVSAKAPWSQAFMPPSVLSTQQHHVIVGQKKWKVQGGFPALCHGGLTLLEVAVPFIEFKAI